MADSQAVSRDVSSFVAIASGRSDLFLERTVFPLSGALEVTRRVSEDGRRSTLVLADASGYYEATRDRARRNRDLFHAARLRLGMPP